MSDKKLIYRVIFINNGKTYEIYAKGVNPSHLYGFVEVEKLLFNERGGVVVDPSEEKLQTEFEGVAKTNVPMQSIIRIDEVDKQGQAKISEAKSPVVTPFPLPDKK